MRNVLDSCCRQAWVLKNPVIRPILLERVWVLLNSWFSFLGGDSQRCCWLAEEAHQSLDVLRSRCHFMRRKRRRRSADLILQFREQSLDVLPLCACSLAVFFRPRLFHCVFASEF
jgi:hypothetical protein